MAKGGACSNRFSRPSCCARGNARKRRTGPPRNRWCVSVVFRVATCGGEIAKTRSRRTSKEGIDRSHQDLAIRSLGSQANPGRAQTAVDNTGPKCHTKVWALFGRGQTGGSEDAKTPLCTTWRYGAMVLQDLHEIELYVWPKVGLTQAKFHFAKRQATRGDRVAPF